MNNHLYLSTFRRRVSLVIILTVVVTGLSVAVTALLPERLAVSVAIGVNVSDRQTTPDYKFSRYYGTQASEKFSETVASWFQSPEVVQRIFDRASLNPGTTSLSGLAKIFKAESLAAQNVEVDFTTATTREADQLLAAIKSEVAEKTAELNRDEEAVFETVINDPIVVPQTRNYLVNGVVGIIVGLILGLGLAALREYWTGSVVRDADVTPSVK